MPHKVFEMCGASAMEVCHLSPPLEARVSDWLEGCDWAVQVGVPSAELLRELEGQGLRVLVIEANSRRAHRLLKGWPQGLPSWIELFQEPVGALSDTVRWYCYNDPRMDGPQTPEDLGYRYRNLSLIGEESRLQHSLDEVVRNWWGTTATPSGSGVLLIQSLDPEPLLEGAKDLLATVRRLVLLEASEASTEPPPLSRTLEARLTEACFRLKAAERCCWERDERMLLQRELQLAQAEVERLNLLSNAQAEELTLQRKSLLATTEQLEMELQETRSRLEDLEPIEHAQALTQQELDQLRAELDQLVSEHSLLQQQHNALQQESEGQRPLNQQISDENQRLREAYELAVQEKEALTKEQEGLRMQLESLQRSQQELARMTERSELELAIIRDLYVQINTARSSRQE